MRKNCSLMRFQPSSSTALTFELLEPRMVYGICHTDSLVRLFSKQLEYEVLRPIWAAKWFKTNILRHDLHPIRFSTRSVKWQAVCQQLEQNDAERPTINFIILLESIMYFRSLIRQCTTVISALPINFASLVHTLEIYCHPKINQFQISELAAQ